MSATKKLRRAVGGNHNNSPASSAAVASELSSNDEAKEQAARVVAMGQTAQRADDYAATAASQSDPLQEDARFAGKHEKALDANLPDAPGSDQSPGVLPTDEASPSHGMLDSGAPDGPQGKVDVPLLDPETQKRLHAEYASAAEHLKSHKVTTCRQPVVDLLWSWEGQGKISFSGSLIPDAWLEKLTNPSGHIYWIAVFVLADIVYHYRSSLGEPDATGRIALKKRFKYSLYHLNRAMLAKKLKVNPDTISEALHYLEYNLCLIQRLGGQRLIKRRYDQKINERIFQQNIYIELNPIALQELCRKDAEDSAHVAGTEEGLCKANSGGSPPQNPQVGTSKPVGGHRETRRLAPQNRQGGTAKPVITEKTPKETTEITTATTSETPGVVVAAPPISPSATRGLTPPATPTHGTAAAPPATSIQSFQDTAAKLPSGSDVDEKKRALANMLIKDITSIQTQLNLPKTNWTERGRNDAMKFMANQNLPPCVVLYVIVEAWNADPTNSRLWYSKQIQSNVNNIFKTRPDPAAEGTVFLLGAATELTIDLAMSRETCMECLHKNGLLEYTETGKKWLEKRAQKDREKAEAQRRQAELNRERQEAQDAERKLAMQKERHAYEQKLLNITTREIKQAAESTAGAIRYWIDDSPNARFPRGQDLEFALDVLHAVPGIKVPTTKEWLSAHAITSWGVKPVAKPPSNLYEQLKEELRRMDRVRKNDEEIGVDPALVKMIVEAKFNMASSD